jgi:membrane-bound lytic murein transglycosylase A
MKLRNAQVDPVAFAALDGWKDDDHAAAFDAFLKSCDAIRHGTRAMRAARPVYAGLYNACKNAITLAAGSTVDTMQARRFFEDNFKPARILPPTRTYGYYTGADGFYTGYYEPEILGSRVKTDEYSVPLYGVPAKVAGKKSRVFSQYDRVDIEKGALAGKGLEICWVKSPVDAFFAQIQGSTRVKLDNGELLRLNYIASNGKPYTPVGRILIDQGVFTPQEMSMDKIREYMEANPEEGKALREKNRSFVFFAKTTLKPHDEPLGAQGIPVTPGRSIAVDPSIHVYGTPIWIDAKFPLKSAAPEDSFQRLMVAQDTGSAIRGPARADIYFGRGPDVPSIAGRIKQFGKFVMLVPKDVTVNGDVEAPKGVPLPLPRPKAIFADARPAPQAGQGSKNAPLPDSRP